MRSTLAFAITLVVALLASPLHAAAQGPRITGLVSAIPVSGTFVDAAGGTGTFTGTLAIERFASIERALVAEGTITGTLTDSAGGTRSVTGQSVTLPVRDVSVSGGAAPAQADGPITTQQTEQDCQVLHLEFGGIVLDVLGIQLSLSPIVLDLALGGILGGILCGLLGLLGAGAPAPAQANVLNSALGLNP
ncbi:MAG TPA: hypothetical protein VJP45_04945 [Candidatus Limnocylindria bacterium]|nr:hypothetical protein [Candidatus Limnocylindria bacterium]